MMDGMMQTMGGMGLVGLLVIILGACAACHSLSRSLERADTVPNRTSKTRSNDGEAA